MGKPIVQGRGEVRLYAGIARYYAERGIAVISKLSDYH
jgi:hypothetical protein